jgi:hypothetical protein
MTLTQITPFVPCTSLAAQIGFFCDTLGFTAGFQSEFYAFVHRDGVAVRLVQVSDEVDAVYAAMKPALDKLPEGRVRAPFNQPYDQREFHVFDEDCTLIFFGEAIASNTK